MAVKLFLPSHLAPRQQAPEIWIPGRPKPAQKKIAMVFYHHPPTGRIVVGFPEQFPVPPSFAKAGYQKVVCRSLHEVEVWDKKLRDQEKREEEMTEEQREAFEGPIRAWARAELVTSYMNARNPINKAFCKQALDRLDEDERRRKMKKESFMHVLEFEDRK